MRPEVVAFSSKILERRRMVRHLPPCAFFGRLIAVIVLAGCTLTVRTVGNGTGNVSSGPGGINCGGGGTNCSETSVQPTAFTLTTTAGNGSIFTGWGGACSGIGSCSVTLDSNKTVFAYFQPALAVGAYHTCAIRNGAVFCWGRNTDGQVGLGPSNFTSQVTTPQS